MKGIRKVNMKTILGLTLLLPAMILDCIVWLLGGWTKGSPMDMPFGQYVWKTFLRV